MGMKGVVGGGEIVQVQGGHIVRSTGRKDRHSKVYTAKGPRDRRVRLSAHTAIQFYDVQDRLGYDRPSKAVDWLIKKAKSAIDKLAELPPWHPTANSEPDPENDPNVPVSGEVDIGSEEQSGYGFQLQRAQLSADENTDFIADTMKSFFPTTTSVAANSSMSFQNYAQDSLPTQDLGLSLHSFQDQGGGADHAPPNEQAMFGSVVGFGSSSFQRMVAWNGHDNQASCGESRGLAFHAPPTMMAPHGGQQQHHGLLGQGAAGAAATPFSHNQRGTLQSSFSTPLVRAWDDLPSMAAAAAAAASSQRPQQQHIHHSSPSSSSIFGTRFVSDGSGLPVFCIPARIHGEDEEGRHGVVSERPSSSSSPNSAHH
ncbi:hypothetical protein TIFTF001_023074 [Ficus carica]|uniref:TCP domain-containing protein n=1 Tax=Ficus carica TaxID=3494 RepID=A0AA88AL65_FICCA|nr:hypothetical protein TIFTF001_023074 [Ficus carica]